MTAKSSSRFKTIAAAGLLSAALVGCGGGSESTVSTTPEPTPAPAPAPDPYAGAKKALADAQMAYANLPATATYADKQQKQAAIKTAADALVTALQTGGAPYSEVASAMNVSSTAEGKSTAYGNVVTEQGKVTTAQNALAALPATATYEQKRDAQQAIKTAADGLVTALQTSGASTSEVQAATGVSTTADGKATIYGNIVTAEGKLKTAQGELNALPDDATSEKKIAAQKKIKTAAETLVVFLERDSDSTTTEITNAKTIASTAQDEIDKLEIPDDGMDSAWENAISNYELSGFMNQLPQLGGLFTSSLETEVTPAGTEITFDYGGNRLTGNNVNLGEQFRGWTGESYGERYKDGARDFGRIFTSHAPATNINVAWGNLVDIQGAGSPGIFSTTPLGLFVTMNPIISTNAGTDGRVDIGATDNVIGATVTSDIPGEAIDIVGGVANFNSGNGTTATNGTLFGRPGRFRCDQNCVITLNADSVEVEAISANATTLQFTPAVASDYTVHNTADLAEHSVELRRPDNAYTRFGYWAYITPDSPFVYVDTFAIALDNADGMGFLSATNAAKLTGSAKYDGLAAGFYILNSDNELHNGEFTAGVSLTANFNRNEIGGDIDNFRSVTDNDHDLSNWKLGLGSASLGANNNNLNQVFRGATDGGGTAGQWQGEFAGNDGLNTLTLTDDHPQVVAGEFIGNFGDSNQAIGAFGAEIN